MPDSTPDPARIASSADLARELTLLRQQAGLTIRQVARSTGLLTSTLGGYFSGRHRPSVDALDRVLDACGVPVDERSAWRDAAVALRRASRRPVPDCPYPGLESFQPEDAARFHGRGALTRAVLEALDAGGGPLVVVGASGSGKSSVLRAGVVAALREQPGVRAAVLTPGRAPLEALARALDGDGDGDGDGGRHVLVVDQFEEVFGPDVVPADRAGFVDALSDARMDVVLGLRADFYPHALTHPALAEALQHRQIVVGPMGADDLREAITAPATHAGVPVDDGLVELLVDDTLRQGSAGGLPLLSHALLATWQRAAGAGLTVAHYRATGGVEGAVATSAEDAVTALGPDRADAVRQLFLRLVTVTPDAADTRRRCARSDLPAAVTEDVLDAFVARRLLVVDTGTVEIAHEALIGAWPRLRGWLDADRVGAATRRQTAEAARAWRDAGEDPDLLLRGVRLAGALDGRDGGLNDLEDAFLRAGQRQEEHQRAERRLRTRRLRRLVAALAVLVLLTGGLAVFSASQAGEIASARDVAVSRQVAVRADALRADDPALAAQLAVAAYGIAPTAEARASLLNSTASPMPTRLPGLAGLVSTVVTDAARQLVVTASGAEVRLWSAADGTLRPLGAPLVAAAPVTVVALAADGRTLAVGAGDVVVTHALPDPARPGPALPVADVTARGLAFGPDGATLYVAGEGVRRIDLASGTTGLLPGGPEAAESVAAGPGGAVAASDGSGTVALWPSPDSAPLPLTGPTGRVPALLFSPDGRTLLAGSTDRAVYRWDVAVPARPVALPSLTGPTNWVNAVSVGVDGTTAAIGSSDGTARLLEVATGRVTATFPHPAPVTAAVLTSAGTLVTATADGTGHIWPVRGPVLSGFDDAVFALAFDDSGERLVIGPGSKDDTARLWTTLDPAGPRPIGPAVANPEGEPSFSGSAALTPDGATLAVGRTDGSVRLWDVGDPAAPVALGAPLAPSGQLVEQLTISRDGSRLAASGDDNAVRLWDITDPTAPRPQPTLVGATSYVFASSFSPDGTLLAAASADANTYLWDVRDPAAPRLVATLDGPESFAYSAVFTPDGRTLAVGSADRTVRLWDVSRPDRPALLGEPLTGPANYVYSVAFSPDGGTLAAASTDGTVWTWDVRDLRDPEVSAVLTGPTDAVFSVAWSPDGTRLAGGSADRTVRLWTADPARARDAVCASVGVVLDAAEWDRYVPDLPYSPPC